MLSLLEVEPAVQSLSVISKGPTSQRRFLRQGGDIKRYAVNAIEVEPAVQS